MLSAHDLCHSLATEDCNHDMAGLPKGQEDAPHSTCTDTDIICSETHRLEHSPCSALGNIFQQGPELRLERGVR